MDVTCNRDYRNLYLIGLTLGVLSFLKNETLWEIPDALRDIFRYTGMLLLTIKLVTTLPSFSLRICAASFFFLIISVIAGRHSGTLMLLSFTYLTIFSAKGVLFKDILKTYLCIGGVFCLLTMLASVVGILENRVKETTIRELVSSGLDRYSFGYKYTTNYANHVFFILLAGWCYYYGRINKLVLLSVYTCLAIFVFIYTDCRLSSFCILLIVVFSVLSDSKKIVTYIYDHKLFGWVFVLVIPLFCFLSIYSSYAFNPSNEYWSLLNIILSFRLSIGQDALVWAGIPLFGQVYEMYSGDVDKEFYNYIDSSYLQSSVIYGAIYTICICYLSASVCRKAYKERNTHLLFAVVAAGVSGLVAQHYIQIYMNPILLGYLSIISNSSEYE